MDWLFEKIVEKKVYLQLEVKVEKDWRKKQNILKNAWGILVWRLLIIAILPLQSGDIQT